MNENNVTTTSQEKACVGLETLNPYLDEHRLAIITAHSKSKSAEENETLSHKLSEKLSSRGYKIYKVMGTCLDRESGEKICETYFAAIDENDRDIETFSNEIFSLRNEFEQEKGLVFSPGSGGLIAYSDGDVDEYDCDYFEEWFSFTSFNYGTPLEITRIELCMSK